MSNEIRARFDASTIVVYQAYSPAIAVPAATQKKFVSPFSLTRMTWIKPSFLWMMERSGWARKPGQEHVLAIRIGRASWEAALTQAVLTHPDASVYPTAEAWRAALDQGAVRVQWDPERTLRGAKAEYRSIQVGLSRHVIADYAERWIVDLEDITPLVHKIDAHRRAGRWDEAHRLLPEERIYPVSQDIQDRLGM
jgi:hypothetical protein